MMKVLKWGMISVGALIVLLILAALIVPQFVDVQKYKPQIEKRVAEATGRPVKIGGNIDLSLFPWVGVAVSDLHMGNPPGFDQEDFLSVQSFEARVKVLPLIKRDIQVQRFVLEKPRIVLIRNKDGRGNWEGLAQTAGKPAERPEKGPGQEKPTEGLPLSNLVVGEFTITDGSILWIDRLSGKRKEVSDMNLALRNVSLDNPIKLDFSAQLDGEPLALQGNVGPVGREPGKGTIPLDLTLKALKQVGLRLKGQVTDPAISPSFDLQIEMAPFSPRKLMAALGRSLPVETADPNALQQMAFAAHIQGNRNSVNVSDGTLDLDDSHLSFSVQAKDLAKPDLSFDMRLDSIAIDRYLPAERSRQSGRVNVPKIQKAAATTATKGQGTGTSGLAAKFELGPLRKAVVDGSIAIGEAKLRGATIKDIKVVVSGKDGVFKIDPFSLQLYDGALVTRATLDVSKDEPHYTADLQLPAFSPRKLVSDLGKDFPIKTTDPQALNRIAFKAKISGTPRRVDITDGALDLDESHLRFTFKAKDLAKPDILFDINIDEIDLDRYLPPPSEKPAAESAGKRKEEKAAPQPSPPAKRDYTALRQAVLDGRVRIGKLKVRNARAGDFDLKVTGKNGVFKVDPLTLKAYEGTVTSASVLDVTEPSPKSKVDLKISGLQVGPFLREVMNKDVLEGTMQGDVALNMQGDEPARIKRTLNGQGELLFKDGAIKGIDLAGMVRNVEAKFGLAEKTAERPRTDFSELRSPFTMKNGVFNTSDTALLSPLLRVRAAGKADLVAETLDFRVEPKFVGTLKGQGDTVERAGVMVPVLVQGTFAEPKFRPDLAGMIRTGLGDRLPKEIPQELKTPSLEKLVPGKEGTQEAPGKQLEEKAKDLLKSLPFQKN